MKTQLFTLNPTISAVLFNRWWLQIMLNLLLLTSLSSVALGQTKLWDKTIGGSDTDDLLAILATADGGYLLGGSSYSGKSGDKTEKNKGNNDYWIVKLNADGTKVWDKTFGGTGQEDLQAMAVSTEGGYLLGGNSSSDISGDKSQPSRGGNDYWVVKIDEQGNKLWDKTFGSGSFDNLTAIVATPDGGFLLGGSSQFGVISVDKTEANKGFINYWVVKINGNGIKEWDRTLGGGNSDQLKAMVATTDGGYLLGGYSNSPVSGDKTEPNREINCGRECTSDYWIIKIDKTGTKVWDKTFGSSGLDELYAIAVSPDGGYLLAGNSSSDISGDKSQPSKGGNDYWVVKIDEQGNKLWDKTLGGNDYDNLSALVATTDKGYLLGGSSFSGIGADKSEANRRQVQVCSTCSSDYWVVKINEIGNKEWDKTIGGGSNDDLYSLQQTIDGGYILGGTSVSDISGEKSEASNGNCNEFACDADYWVVKLGGTVPCNQTITSFTLMNADTGEELMALQQGDTVDLTTLPAQNLSMRANTAPAAVGRVIFTLDNNTEVIDNIAPYISNTKFSNGPHTLTAIPYCEAENGGGKGTALTVNFQVISNERIVTITPDEDNTINSTSPESNDGASVALRVGRTGSNGNFRLQRTLLHFDLSSIPPGSRIDSAILTMYVVRTGASETGVALHKVTTEWSELESTWSHAIFPNIPWTTPGGDFAPTATASIDNVSSDSGTLKVSQLAADVQTWVNDSISNLGWVLKVTDEEITNSAKLITSRESAESERPSLRIVYTVKEENPDQPAVQSFTLVNAQNEQDLMSLTDGDTVNLAMLPTHSLNIRANTSQRNSIDVKFALSGQQSRTWTELGYPFALYGDEGGNYHGWTPAPGTYTLTATPYTDAGGVKGTPLTISFTIVNKVAVQSFTLVNAKNEQDLMPLSDGDTIDLAALPTRFLNIRANTSQRNGINVAFALSGRQSRTWTELGYPYALYGDEGGNYHSWAPPRGEYTLTTTPSLNNGAPGKALTISFTVVGQRPVTASSSSSSIAEESQAAEIVYPNPTRTGKIKLVLPQQVQGEITYTLVSLLGAKVAGGQLNLSRPTTEVAFDFSAQMQAKGVYFLHLKGQHLQTVLRVVRQ